MQKRGQTWSLETYLSIGIFLIAIIMFYGLTVVGKSSTNINIEVEEIGRAILNSEELHDMKITPDELNYLISLSCDDLKTLYQTPKDLCIYLVDSNNNLLVLQDNRTVYGIGCPSINVSGRPCGTIA
jgi:hypothetical protein